LPLKASRATGSKKSDLETGPEVVPFLVKRLDKKVRKETATQFEKYVNARTFSEIRLL
jgi:hypothetical protein